MRLAHTIGFCFLAAVLTGVVYLNTLDNLPTNWDDPAIFANPVYHGLSLAHLAQALTFKANASFQPLRDISYMIDFTLCSTPQGLLRGLHVHNILLYIGLVVACFLFLRLLLRALAWREDRAAFLAAATSLIYAVHPVHVESVAWLYARKEPLLGLFTFLCLAAFIKARLDRQRGWYVASAITLALAILAKPTAVVLPAVILLLDIAIRLRRHEAVPWRTGALFLLPLAAFAAWQAVRLLGMMQAAGGVLPYHGGSFATNLLAVSQIFVAYFQLAGLTFTYAADYPLRLYASPHQWQAWAFLSVNAVVIAGAVWAFVKGRYLYPFFVFWHYAFILPVSNIVPISQVLADRYDLLSSLSWCVLLGYGLSRVRFMRLPSAVHLLTPTFPRLLAWVLTGAIVAGYAALTIRQNDVWQNAQHLWEHTVALYPNSFPGNVNLSILYLNQKRYAEAEQLCITALSNLPQANLFGVAHLPLNNLAAAQMGQGKYPVARRNYAQVLQRNPRLLQARLGLANCGWEMRDFTLAYAQYRFILQNLSVGPPRVKADVLFRAGYAAWKLGRRDEATGYLDQSAQVDRANPSRLLALAEVYDSMGLPVQAQAVRARAGKASTELAPERGAVSAPRSPHLPEGGRAQQDSQLR